MIYKEFYDSIGLTEYKSLNRIDRIKFNRYVFEKIYRPKMDECVSKNLCIQLSDKDLGYIKDFSKNKTEAKRVEWKGFDDKNRSKREMTGACIEYALLKYFNREDKFDDSIVKFSSKKNYPDLLPLGILCDIKGSSVNNVPLVFKTSRAYICKSGKHSGKRYRCSNIIGITDHKSVWLLGIASPDILENYVDNNLIIISENTTKTGFYGADKLVDIPKDWKSFKKLCTDKSVVVL